MLKGHILTQVQTAELLNISIKTLQAWRYKGEGPKFYKPRPGVIRYYMKDVIAWLESKNQKEVSHG